MDALSWVLAIILFGFLGWLIYIKLKSIKGGLIHNGLYNLHGVITILVTITYVAIDTLLIYFYMDFIYTHIWLFPTLIFTSVFAMIGTIYLIEKIKKVKKNL